MGFELVFTAPQFTQAQWKQVISCFEENGQFTVVEQTTGEQPSVAYTFEAILRKTWPEDFLVANQPPGVYLLFHSATSQQQAQVTTLLTDCLQQVGIMGTFEEL